MSKIAIVTDSTAYLTSDEVAAMHNVFVAPISFTMKGHVYIEGVSMDNDEFYTTLPTLDKLPTTAPPTPQDMLSLYDKIADQGYDQIISIHLTSGITGFINNLKMFTQNYSKAQIVIYDSHITIEPMAYLVRVASQLANEGTDLKTILDKLDELRASIGVFFVVDDLKNLVTGGRLSNSAAFAGGLLKIKPILNLTEDTHQIVPIGKIRTMKKALQNIEDRFAEVYQDTDYPLHVMLSGTNNLKAIEDWQVDFSSRYPDTTTEVGQIGPVVGTHIGSNSFVLSWIKEYFTE
ncbi:degV family protein [Lentilactobacillus senioris DSM 24302 = JCM 17472]|uniref:DegV family protein n=1 Tax=Lentilactobacillus senioris DSM 24302 = JCM 17472 TaxID=1423802 RepID=A0A0R2D1P8_9LACO|nr:DegV family protein [Lentilactobacillus senioris]KRM94363.1 degV family protein [Lentilactobacillus senioris DSM 24302 = JCM 17472]